MKLQLDFNSPKPLHLQAEELLRALIIQEEYQNGKLLPSETDLASEMNISRNTLRQSINKLVFEGLLTRKKGYGTTVIAHNVMSNGNKWKSFSQEMHSMGLSVKNFELHVSWKIPPEEVRSFFKSSENQKLLCLERLRGNADLAFVYFISYFNPNIGLTGDEDMAHPLYETLEKNHGVQVKTSREMINARRASAYLAKKLDIEEGDPILVRKRYVLDVRDVPVEYNIGYYRADNFTYSIEFTNV